MKDRKSSEADRQKGNPTISRKAESDAQDRRNNLDEVARYVVEGLDRRKQKNMVLVPGLNK